MPSQPTENRSHQSLQLAFRRFLRARRLGGDAIHQYQSVLVDYIGIASRSGLLALPTRIVLGSGTWGWTFRLAVDLGEGDQLQFGVQKNERQYGILHELELNKPVVTAWRAPGSSYDMSWPGGFPDDAEVRLSNVEMVAVYSTVLRLAVQAPVFADQIPQPQDRWWGQ